MKKIALLLFLLFAFAGIANAVSLSAPQEIPASVNWSFVADFENFNFNEAKFFLDEKPLATIFTYNSALLLAPNSTDNSLVLNISISGNKVFASMAGVSEGEHNLKANLFSAGQQTDSVSAKIIVSNSLDSAYKTEVQSSLDSLKESINSFAVEINKLKSDAADLQASKAGTEQKISEISSAIDALNEKISKIDGELGLLISDIEALRQNPSVVKGNQEQSAPNSQPTQPAQEAETAAGIDSNKEQASAPTGFFSIGQSGLILWIFAGILAIIAVFLVFRIAKEKGISFGSGLRPYHEDQGVLGSGAMQGNTDDQKQGKWSFEKQPEKKPSKGLGLNFGNLIRRSH
ncbi:MAG: hypothetical protein PHD95_00465 [Candidatus ainarchaeum sp.]|nr:hypothetical protein [Candidatus ainarchaeum sp.]